LYISIPPKPQFTGFASRLLSADLRADMRAGRIFRFRGTIGAVFSPNKKHARRSFGFCGRAALFFSLKNAGFPGNFFAYTDLCYHFVLLLTSAFLPFFRFSGRKKRNVR
jgi:hypothetical protein